VCMPHLVVTKARPGKVIASMEIKKHNVNRLNGLHGGLISSLVDTMGSLALSSQGLWMTGVSTDMSITFVRGAGSPGDSIRCEGHLLNAGKTLAFTRVDIFSAKTNKLVATGTHTKYIANALKNEHGKNIKFDESGANVIEGQLQDDPGYDAVEEK